jgi:hypothetical protein
MLISKFGGNGDVEGVALHGRLAGRRHPALYRLDGEGMIGRLTARQGVREYASGNVLNIETCEPN